MYWPVGTPRIYATTSTSSTSNGSTSGGGSSNRTPPAFNFVVSDDGASASSPAAPPKPSLERPSLPPGDSYSSHDALNLLPQPSPLVPPGSPTTPLTPSIKSVENAFLSHDGAGPHRPAGAEFTGLPVSEPLLALRVSRSGQIFATITATSMTVWQTKPTVVLAAVVRSEASVRSYGTNVDLLLRPDSAIFVVHTSSGFLITYSLATDAEARVYRPLFTSHNNVQRRRQSHSGGPGHTVPDQILWGPGEGPGVRDVSVRFKMVIKVDAGIESALALDDELVVATRKPAAVQCIRWTPDSRGSQTSTEILSRMGWLEKRTTVVEMTNDRPMNLSTWITGDGRAYAVQRTPGGQPSADTGETDPRKLFKGYCFHVPRKASAQDQDQDQDQHTEQDQDRGQEKAQGRAAKDAAQGHDRGVRAVINARFSLIAVGCADGNVRVYSVKDYAGNIPASHVHRLPVSRSAAGALTTLTYSPDGYCLFAGYERGWATWSVYGKPLSSSFGADATLAAANGEAWLAGVRDAAWIGGAAEMLLVGPRHEAVWLLEMARNAVTGCYGSANLFRTVLQTTASVMVYRGYDLPDLTSISAEPSLWHTAGIPAAYLLHQWPIKCTVVSPDGRYVAVAGRRGLAHYSVNSGRWKTFVSDEAENEFQVKGGMCWHQNVLVAAVEGAERTHELRLYSREAALDGASVLHRVQMPSPVVLLTPSGEDSLLVYTHSNLLHHFIFTSSSSPSQAGGSGSVRLVQVGQIAFHGIVRSPARVRGLSWILPEQQILNGDPAEDVAHACVLFLVDGKLVLLNPSFNDEGQLKYDMRVVAQSVEYYACMRDQPFISTLPPLPPSFSSFSPLSNGNSGLLPGSDAGTLANSLWLFDGDELKIWPDMHGVQAVVSSGGELPPTAALATDFYPLSVLSSKAIVLGVEPELFQRRDVNFSFFRFAIRTQLFLPEVLRFYLTRNRSGEALQLARRYQALAYFSHALEILLHQVLDEEVDSSPAPEDATLPRVLSLLSSFRDYLDVVVQCTRKTEVRSWRTLFAYLPPPQELFEESLLRGNLKTAGGYLLVLHTFDKLATASEQSVRLLGRAMREGDWELCKELARFLAALDDTGETLREAMEMVDEAGIAAGNGSHEADGDPDDRLASRLGIPAANNDSIVSRGKAGAGIAGVGGSATGGAPVAANASGVETVSQGVRGLGISGGSSESPDPLSADE